MNIVKKMMLVAGAACCTFSASAENRVVCLGGAITETVWALGAVDRVVAIDDSSSFPADTSTRKRVGYYRAVSAEGVLSMDPELVLAHEEAGPPEAMDRLVAAGVPVVKIPSAATVAGNLSRIRAIGAALELSNAAEILAADVERRMVESAVPAEQVPVRVMFVFARGAGTLQVSGDGTAAAEMIHLAGGVNAIQGFDGYRPLTAEALVAANPEVVLITTSGLASMGGEDALWSLPGMQATAAGEQRRVVALDDLYLLGFGPRLPDAVAELQMALIP